MATVVPLKTAPGAATVRTAADRYLDSITVANTRRTYTTALGKVVPELGEGRPLSAVADDEIGQALEQLWGTAASSTWNSRRGAVGGWLAWCHESGLQPPHIPAWCKRMPDPGSDTPVRSKTAIDRLIARRDVALREKVTYRMLYETVARADELLGVNIEDLNLTARQAPVKVKGAKAVRRRGQAREDYATETIYWDVGTARLLPRLIGERTRGPLLVTHRKPGPGKVLTPRDVCPDTGLARLSYGQLRALLDRHTCVGGEEGTGWDPHEFRHSGLTHLGEQGVSLLLFMAKSRHKSVSAARKYFKPGAAALAEVTSLLAPSDSRR
ncbi:tyrosine-type recombinase/integrase [Streptomyces flavidovirens]|uniref:tyrosine-type recombinase/integrase n=1 Tax=Streptomyces flavidovirens TaxID=67298 RepID=UPI0036C783AD